MKSSSNERALWPDGGVGGAATPFTPDGGKKIRDERESEWFQINTVTEV